MTNDERMLLASAYLDGEVTDDERRAIENDPELMTEVAGLRAAVQAVSDVSGVIEQADDSRREQSIAAALAEFDRTIAGSPAGATTGTGLERGTQPVAPVVPFDRASRRSNRWLRPLGAAAAVAVVAVAGVVVLTRGDDSNDATESDRVSATAPTVVSAPAAERSEAEALTTTPRAPEMPTTAVADPAEERSDGAAAVQDEAPAAAPPDARDDAGVVPTSAPSAGGAPPAPPTNAAPPTTNAPALIETEDDLAELVAPRPMSAGPRPTTTPPPKSECGTDPVVGRAVYDPADGPPVVVEITLSDDRDTAIARSIDDCEIVLTADLG